MMIAPSILSADFANLQSEIELVEKGGASCIHVDVMDGQFVPNITFGANIVQAIRPITKLPLDVHLMIISPENYILDFAKAGADSITVHVESTPHIHRAVQMIKELDINAGVVLNPGTPIAMIKHVLPIVNQVLVMTVNPGFGGQRFIEEMVSKIAKLNELRQQNNWHYVIEVDGGIIPETAKICHNVGADVFVAGSYVYRSKDPVGQIIKLQEALNE